MSSKEDILSKYRKNIQQKYDMPSLDDIKAITYPDPTVYHDDGECGRSCH